MRTCAHAALAHCCVPSHLLCFPVSRSSIMADSEEEWLHVLPQALKEESSTRDHAPKRKRNASSIDDKVPEGSDTGPSKNKRRVSRTQKARAPSSNKPTTDDDTSSSKWAPRTAVSANIMFTRYAGARTKSHREKLRNVTVERVACTHDQRGDRVWDEYKNTFNQLRKNEASGKGIQNNPCGCIPSIPQRGWEEIEEARCDFFAANRGLHAAERRLIRAQMVEQCSLDAVKTLVRARRRSEESLRLALASVHPYQDLLRMRLATTLRQSVADTAAIISLSKTTALSHASATAITNAKVSLFSRQKLACRFNREVTICRVNGTGDSATGGEGVSLRLRRVKDSGRFSVPLPRTTKALDEPQASIPDPGISPRMRVVFSQLKAIATAAEKSITDKKGRVLQPTKCSTGRKVQPVMA